jgi:hypothetical protein
MRKHHAQIFIGEDNSSTTSEKIHEFDADEEQSHADVNVADHAHWTAIDEHGASEIKDQSVLELVQCSYNATKYITPQIYNQLEYMYILQIMSALYV